MSRVEKAFSVIGLMSIGIYRSLSIIGIVLGLFLFFRAIHGDGIGPLVTLLIGIFVIIKEILDMLQYASMLNFVGIGVGLILFFVGISGNGIGPFVLAVLGGFVVFKELFDLLHSGH